MKSPMFKAAIVDNEEDSRALIALLLRDNFPEIQIVCNTGAFEEACNSITLEEPEILFLDVELPQGTGFQLLDKLPFRPASVIFITAHDKYAIEAIKSHAIDFMLKPLSTMEFKISVQKVRARLEEEQRELLYKRRAAYAQTSKIAVPNLNGLDFLEIDDILYMEADSNYTRIYLPERREVVCRSLSMFESELIPFGFLRIHHKYLIHLKKIKRYCKGKGGGCITLQNNILLPVSARRKSELFKHFVY
jgi:two-component system LytT family response regulator